LARKADSSPINRFGMTMLINRNDNANENVENSGFTKPTRYPDGLWVEGRGSRSSGSVSRWVGVSQDQVGGEKVFDREAQGFEYRDFAIIAAGWQFTEFRSDVF